MPRRQHALSALSGMDAVVTQVRIALETDPDMTAVSLGGRWLRVEGSPLTCTSSALTARRRTARRQTAGHGAGNSARHFAYVHELRQRRVREE